jgi:hypothetical protein
VVAFAVAVAVAVVVAVVVRVVATVVVRDAADTSGEDEEFISETDDVTPMVCKNGVGRSMICLSQYRNLDFCVTKYEEGDGFRYAEIYELDFCKMAGLT